MKIVLRKTSFVDYPGRISSVLFFSGCNLRCPWCHNRELITGGAKDLIEAEEGLAHIKKRRSVLGGVVLSGGEPCLWEDLPELVTEIKSLSLPVKLDTNGMFPEMLEKLISNEKTRPDYIALDLKIAPERYVELAGNGELGMGNGAIVRMRGFSTSCDDMKQKPQSPLPIPYSPIMSGDKLIRSAAIIRESGIAHEYRTLALPGGFITEADIEALAPLADESPWYFRPFRAGNCLDPAWDSLEESHEEVSARLKSLAKKAREIGRYLPIF